MNLKYIVWSKKKKDNLKALYCMILFTWHSENKNYNKKNLVVTKCQE